MDFETLYKTYWQRIFRLCMGFVNDVDWAKDITQETFIIVWQKQETFRNEANISTWIFRIATNNCLRQIEKQKRLPKSELNFDVSDEVTPNLEDQTKYLYQSISELHETDRIIISLELEDIKQAEIAKIVGISEANVRVKIHRIKEKLTEKFKKYER